MPITDEPPRLLVSIILPAYQSNSTIAQALHSILSQTYTCYEVIVIDSSPNDLTAQIVTSQFPTVVYRHWPTRLLPHQAQNEGSRLAHGDYLLFTTPDVYAHPEWVSRLITTQLARGGVAAGAIQNHHNSWLTIGLHLSKFDSWLTRGVSRPITIGTGSSFLISNNLFEQVGRFDGQYFVGDTVLSLTLAQLKIPIWFAPQAIVAHDHSGSTWLGLLHEMFKRGHEFGQIRITKGRWSKAKVFFFLLVSGLMIRLPKILGRIWLNAGLAGQGHNFVLSFPIILTAHISRLLGEVLAYAQYFRLVRKQN